MRPSYDNAIRDLELLSKLAQYAPVVIGTPPLGIATEESDIDVACSCDDLAKFGRFVQLEFGHFDEFEYASILGLSDPAVRATFTRYGWQFDLFCQTLDVEDQSGVRHFRVEKRILDLRPSLRSVILHRKRQGKKTEPAFAEVLNLLGDPYSAMRELSYFSDEDLARVVDAGAE